MMRRNTRVNYDFTITRLYNPAKLFIEQYGAIQYTQGTGKTYREWTQDTGICEMCRGYGSRFRVIVDHCHKHGWIRGFICNSCNTLLGKYELGVWTNYDTIICPHIHWKYQYPSGKISQQAITNYENCLRRIGWNIELHRAWVAQISKCPECEATMPPHRMPELLEVVPDGVARRSSPRGQISAEYLMRIGAMPWQILGR
jgi:recombination endonuclease VII